MSWRILGINQTFQVAFVYAGLAETPGSSIQSCEGSSGNVWVKSVILSKIVAVMVEGIFLDGIASYRWIECECKYDTPQEASTVDPRLRVGSGDTGLSSAFYFTSYFTLMHSGNNLGPAQWSRSLSAFRINRYSG